MPPGVVFAIPGHSDPLGVRLQIPESARAPAAFHFPCVRCPPIPASCLATRTERYKVLLRALAFERGQGAYLLRSATSSGFIAPSEFLSRSARAYRLPFAEDQQIGQRIPPEPIRSVQSGAALPGSKEAGDVGHLRSASTRTPPIM